MRRGVTAVDELVQERGPIIVSEDGHINVRLMCAGVCERMRGLQVCKFASSGLFPGVAPGGTGQLLVEFHASGLCPVIDRPDSVSPVTPFEGVVEESVRLVGHILFRDTADAMEQRPSRLAAIVGDSEGQRHILLIGGSDVRPLFLDSGHEPL